VILGHHAGEQLLVAALAGGSTLVGAAAVVARVNLDRVLRWLNRR
jgi:hypothetical protein